MPSLAMRGAGAAMPRELTLSPGTMSTPVRARALRRPAPPVLAAASPQSSSPRQRGKALLQGRLRPAEADDELLAQITRELAGGARSGDPLTTDSAVEAVAMVQWYPGHIAKAERELREQLKAVDIVFEVRDGRIPMSTRHPQIPEWVGGRPRVMVLNRRDQVPDGAAKAWTAFFKDRGHTVTWTNANQGEGVARVVADSLAVSAAMNEKRAKRGLRPRPVRAVVVGFPNVGKSALINRLLGRRMADSAPRPGVTRQLRWMRIGGDLDLLDAPGIIPMSFKDQLAAQRLAMCNDIGEASYDASAVAAALLATVAALPEGPAALKRVEQRYTLRKGRLSEEEYVHAVGDKLFNREPERAGQRILKDFRNGVFGTLCLEMPQDYAHYKAV